MGFGLFTLRVAAAAAVVFVVIVAAVSVTSAISHAERDEWQTSVGKW